MKVTKKQLKRIIQEELRRNIYENLATNPLEGKTTITQEDVNAALEDLRARLGPDFEEAMAEAEAQLPDYLKGSSLQEADPVTTGMGIASLIVMIAYMYDYYRRDDDPSDSGISDPKYARRDVPPSGE